MPCLTLRNEKCSLTFVSHLIKIYDTDIIFYMRNSKYISKKTLIPAAITAVAVGLIIWGLSPAIAVVNQTINNGAAANTTLPTP
jgi:hypothetical protein